MIKTLHLIHHSHTDLGYTDLPQTCLDLHVDYLRQAMGMAEATLGESEANRFRWTAEVLGPVSELLAREPAAKTKILRLIKAGVLEVGALPWNFSTLLHAREWQAIQQSEDSRWKSLGCRTAMQNDVNGLSWGIIPGLLDHGIRFLVMGLNGYAGRFPVPPPAAWYWEGPDGRRILTWLSKAYCSGFDYFHDKAWRRGPVPPSHDAYFHAPAGRDTFDERPAALERAHRRLTQVLAKDHAAWPFENLMVQITNHYRMDNDPPCAQLARFVKAWNAAGYAPNLELSTPSRFLARFEREAEGRIPVKRGDWVDAWADGLPSFPREAALGQRAKRRLAAAADLAQATRAPLPEADSLWRQSQRWTEHTFASYDSVPRPWSPSTQGQACALFHDVYALHEQVLLARRKLLERQKGFVPSIHAKGLKVMASEGAQQGWVDVPAAAMPAGVTGIAMKGGKILPFEDLLDAEWSDPVPGAPKAVAIPDDVWGFHVVRRRAWIPKPGTYRFVRNAPKVRAPRRLPLSGKDRFWKWRFDGKRNSLASLVHRPSGVSVLETVPYAPFAALIMEEFRGPFPYAALTARDPSLAKRRTLRSPPALDFTLAESAYGPVARWRRKHPSWHDARQELRLLPDGSLELTTRVWWKESFEPKGLYLSLPLAIPGGAWSYDALGVETRVGPDQLPGTCGEHLSVGRGVVLRGKRLDLALDCIDSPVLARGIPAARSGVTAENADRQRLSPCLMGTWWSTNFPNLRSGLVEHRHVLRPVAPGTPMEKLFPGELWHYPS